MSTILGAIHFAFYDLETTGLDPAFNQPLQFAAILVDDNFVVLERVNLRCRLSSHILPSPYAMAVTGVTPKEVTDASLPSYFEFAQQIRSLIQKWAPATWVGYNTIGFDEPCLRQMFYQTLQPDLYETQFNGNDRLDIMLAVQSAWVYQPTIFIWPKMIKVSQSLNWINLPRQTVLVITMHMMPWEMLKPLSILHE